MSERTERRGVVMKGIFVICLSFVALMFLATYVGAVEPTATKQECRDKCRPYCTTACEETFPGDRDTQRDCVQGCMGTCVANCVNR